MSTSDNPFLHAELEDQRVYNRIASHLHDLRRTMLEFTYWVYKFDNMGYVSLVNDSTQLRPRAGWTWKDCQQRMTDIPYPETMEGMQIEIERAKAEELTRGTP